MAITGIPLQFTTDCGSETTQLFGLITALRYILSPRARLPLEAEVTHNVKGDLTPRL